MIASRLAIELLVASPTGKALRASSIARICQPFSLTLRAIAQPSRSVLRTQLSDGVM